MVKQLGFIIVIFSLVSCSEDDNNYSPVAAPIQIPELFENNILPPVIPIDNPQTEEDKDENGRVHDHMPSIMRSLVVLSIASIRGEFQ